MNDLIHSYQYLPLYLNPTLEIGFFSVSYYSLMYILGFITVYILLSYRIKKGETKFFNKNLLVDFLFYCFVGLLIGARLGHVFFYNLSYFIQNPLAIISPFDPVTHEFIGIYGMSYHGGLIGVFLVVILFMKKYSHMSLQNDAVRKNIRISFWELSDFAIPAVPAGYFFGRIGNFINNELYGKITGKVWGMYFKDSPWQLRHPSQLYEAFLEGIILFIVLWSFRNKEMLRGKILAVYLIGYAIFRFICEYFREPEGSVNYLCFFTLGQLLSIVMMVLGLIIVIFQKRKKLL